MVNLSTEPLWINILVFLGAALVIGFAGRKLASLGDQLADRTGLGEAVTGTVFLGLTTALPGLAVSVTAALEGHAALAVSNAIGGIAIQTVFLAVADVVYRKANLEHAAVSVANMIQTGILITLMVLVLLGLNSPETTVFHVHPVTILLFAAAIFGFFIVYRSSNEPMWRPKETTATVPDVPEEKNLTLSLAKLIGGFLINACLVILAGVFIAHTAGNISSETGISQTVAGGLFAALAASLPELVTTVASVKRGALTLAVSDIVGGNFFDVLFVFAADFALLEGSIYHASGIGISESFLTALAILLNIFLLLGLLYRQRRGPANIGLESLLMILCYIAGYIILSTQF